MDNARESQKTQLNQSVNQTDMNKFEMSIAVRSMINQKCDDLIESISKITEEEKEYLQKLQSEEYLHFHTFVYSFDQIGKLKDYEASIKELIHGNEILRTKFIAIDDKTVFKVITKREKFRVNVKDISHLKEDKRLLFVKNAIAAEERIMYAPDQYMLQAQVIRCNETKNFFVLSVAAALEEQVSGRKILEKIIQYHQEEKAKQPVVSNEVSEKAKKYWCDVFAKNEPIPAIPDKKFRTKRKMTKTFMIPGEIQEKADAFQKRYNLDYRNIILAIYGVMFCKYFQLEKVMVGVIRPNQKLEIVPTFLHKKGSILPLCEELHQQFEQAEENGAISFDQVAALAHVNITKDFPIRFRFSYLPMIEELLKDNAEQKMVMINRDYEKGVQLLIHCNLYGKEKSIQYIYQNELFDDIAIEQLHRTFYLFMEKIMDVTQKKMTYLEEELQKPFSQEQLAEELLKQKITQLQNCTVFNGLPLHEITEICKSSKIITKLDLDLVCKNGEHADSIYIITEGRIEESKAGIGGYIKTIQVLKKGDVFALESLDSNATMKSDYQVFSDYAILMEIPGNLVKEMVKKYPELALKIMEQLQTEIIKFKNLWLLN